MFKLRLKLTLGIALLVCTANVLADCNEAALEGDWKIFYRNNDFPTSVLAAEESIAIELDKNTGNLSVQLTDPDWLGVDGNWETECIDGQTILLGAIQQRLGKATLVIEISRVVRNDDLLRLQNGELRERQINIRFPQPFAALSQTGELARMAERGKLSSHPGHAHGWD